MEDKKTKRENKKVDNDTPKYNTVMLVEKLHIHDCNPKRKTLVSVKKSVQMILFDKSWSS